MSRADGLDLERHYWPRYCEENVWHWCNDLPAEIEAAHVLFISNPGRRVAMWYQRASANASQPVVWDYHVVLLGQQHGAWQIWDADSRLPSPQLAVDYLGGSFLTLPEEHAALRPRFRVVEANEYCEIFRSDRSHMRSANGEWLHAPPPGAPIGTGTNLMRFVGTESDFVGIVLDLPALYDWLGGATPGQLD